MKDQQSDKNLQSVATDETQQQSVNACSRRDVFKHAATLGGLAAAAVLPVSVQAAVGTNARGNAVVAKNSGPIVATEYGQVIGYVSRGVNTFKGIPYGGPTGGANRFKPPVKPASWTGVRSSRYYGYVCPQRLRATWANDEEAFMFRWDDGVRTEDCLRLNVWTPAVNDNGKRPVMVWLHGGGFHAGSGNELPCFDGENLARRGDVVLVSLNHRLNAFGHLDLSEFGEQYASSANVGILDIVAALEWIRDNIAGFGGDPGKVTVFGQSGGGGKINALMAMPGARGLFHRAIVQSGSMLKAFMPEMSRAFTRLVLAELGISPADIQQLHALPAERLVDASVRVMDRRGPAYRPAGVTDYYRMEQLNGYAPVLDGKVIPVHPFDPQVAEYGAGIPLLVGSTLNEFVHGINRPEYENMTLEEVTTRAQAIYGMHTPEVLAAFRNRTPDLKPFDVWSRMAVASVRDTSVKQALAHAAARKAPAYLYWFTWQTPILEGRPRAFHCAEIPFVFNNAERCDFMTGGGPEAIKLAEAMSDCWINFARSGDPNHKGIPNWTPVTGPQSVPTMMFDNRIRSALNVDADELAVADRTWLKG